MKVLIIESSYPKDFYNDELDGKSTCELLKLLGASPKLLYALDRSHFQKAIEFAAEHKYEALHISCHGDENGIALTAKKDELEWNEFAACFQKTTRCPDALIMSACCGADSKIGLEFAKVRLRPKIIFGSTDSRSYSQYAVAWALLYRRFMLKGINRDAAQDALSQINAVVHTAFKYRRWDQSSKKYLVFPGKNLRYRVVEEEEEEKK
jgi:hypothetical protein